MMKITKEDGGFILSHNGVELVQQRPVSPAFRVGTGTCTIRVKSGHYTIEDETLAWHDGSGTVAITEQADALYITIGEDLVVEVTEEERWVRIAPTWRGKEAVNRFSLDIALDSDQPIFGGGEQFSHLDLRGRVLPMWVSEGGVGRGTNYVRFFADLHSGRGGSQEHTYYPQPSFVTADGRWAYLESTAFSRLDFSQNGVCSIRVHALPEALYLGKEATMEAAIAALSSLLGRQPPLPAWAHDGLILGVQGGRAVVEEKLRRARASGIKVSALWCQDWQGIRMTPYGKQLFWNWRYDESLYPDLPGFIEELHRMGIKFLGYINPYLACDGAFYREGVERGFFVKDPESGEAYITRSTTFDIALVDLCNGEAVTWYKQIIKTHMLGIGMDGWMADFGEYLPTDALLFGEGDPYREHNRYPVRWAALNSEAIAEAGKSEEVVFFCRSGFGGSSRHTALVWAGDQTVDFLLDDGLPSVIPAGINAAASGVGNWHFDIGGFFSFAWIKRTRELLARSCETAAFTAVMRTHEGIKPTVNAQFDEDEEMLAHFARMVGIHSDLLFYHQAVAQEYQEHGLPPIRAVIVEGRVVKGQYCYGRDLLIAPMLRRKAKKRRVTLPPGRWVHFFTHELFEGGVYRLPGPIGSPVVFIREESAYFEQLMAIGRRED
jgi:alpha-glucosidase